MTKRVAVLKGGWSPEREVSLSSGAKCAAALREAGFDVVEIDATPDLAAQLKDAAPDLVFNALHGKWGEDGCVQGLLEILGLPYTHSGVRASALAMDKQRSKSVFREIGAPLADSLVASRFEAARAHLMEPPYVVKPNDQGSSVGVVIVEEGANRPPAIVGSEDWAYGDEVMVEAFVPGRELTVTVMGDRALAVTEIVAATSFYDYHAKYAEGGSRHILPADLPQEVAEAALRLSVAAHGALGCRGVTRSDFRYDESRGLEGLALLEVNTQPGMTPTSLAPEQAAHCGVGFVEFVKWMAEDASLNR